MPTAPSAHVPADSPSPLRWRIALLVSIAIAISYLDRQTLPVAIGEIRKDIPIDNSTKAFLDHGFSYTPVLVIAGSLHVAAFFLILATVRSVQPLPLKPEFLTAN